MPVVLRGSAIVAAFMLLTLSGCGQSGPLYLPVVPPLPAPLDPPVAPTPSGTTRTTAPGPNAASAAVAPQAASSSK